jgi:tetratricopeptide (TPR) repeat protein
MNIRCHLAAAVMLFCLQGCILDMFFGGGDKKEDPGIRPVGAEKAGIVPSDLSSDFEKTKDPKITADTWFAAGQLHEAQGSIPAAMEQYRQALKVNDEHHGALYRLGVLYATKRDYPAAIASWKRYINVTHHSAVGYSNLGFSYELSGDPVEAERAYRTGIERDSDSAPCRINYGLMLARHGRIDEGIAQMQPVLSEAEIHYNIGSIHEGQGRGALARAEYQKAVALNPKLKDASIRLRKLDAVTGVNVNE